MSGECRRYDTTFIDIGAFTRYIRVKVISKRSARFETRSCRAGLTLPVNPSCFRFSEPMGARGFDSEHPHLLACLSHSR